MHHPVSTSWISITTEAGPCEAYLALPPGGSGPGLLLYQEIFGVNAHIRGVAEQYALAGFTVLAPDVFWQQRPRIELGYSAEDVQQGRALAGALQADDLQRDMLAALRTLRALPHMHGRKAGVIGYCMGGRLAYTAAALSDVDAAVAYYGGGIQDKLDLAPRIQCPIQFHYGALDSNIPLSAVDKVRAAVQGKDAQVHVYEGAQHGFNCWARGSYHAASSALAHGRSLQFLAQHLF